MKESCAPLAPAGRTSRANGKQAGPTIHVRRAFTAVDVRLYQVEDSALQAHFQVKGPLECFHTWKMNKGG